MKMKITLARFTKCQAQTKNVRLRTLLKNADLSKTENVYLCL